MKIPQTPEAKNLLLQMVIDGCMASQQKRRTMYERRRRYFLYGQDADQKVRFNRMKSHLKLVASFLFSADGLIFNITPPKNADEDAIEKFKALQDDFNQDIADDDLGGGFGNAVLWSIIFDTMVLKIGWNDTTGQLFVRQLEPSSFGVYREDNPEFASQPAMNHSYLLDYDDAVERLKRAGKADLIPGIAIEGESAETGLPPAMQRMIITATGGENLTGNIMGNANPNYAAAPTFSADVLAPTVRFHETWIWDSEAQDYRIFHSFAGGIILSDSKETIAAIGAGAGKDKPVFNSTTNWFLEKENPFIPITPYTLYNYFWGDCHLEDMVPLQEWSNERLVQIEEVLEQQTDPAKVFAGFQGIPDEKAEAFGGPGTWVAQDMPGADVLEKRPPMPGDLFREFDKIGSLMLEQSGLTETVAGRSSGGARGGGQQRQMQITGGGEIRKVAVGLEKSLVRMGDLALKLKRKNDDGEIKLPSHQTFIAAQVEDGYAVAVAGHSHSPLFTLETREIAELLFKARAIDREWFIRMINPPEKQNLLHALRLNMAAEAKAQAAKEAAHPGEGNKKGGK